MAQDSMTLSDNAKISVLTCSPGTEIYELFGHTGLRVYDPQEHIDVVFNYGLFDFNQDSFIYRFVRGKTDYEVGVCPTNSFLIEYLSRGSSVKESVLNLSQKERDKIWHYLLENVKPENKVYRYNFVFNNCATKIRDIIDQNIKGSITYPDVSGPLTFRDAIMLYTENAPWSQFGFDLCLGRDMDKIATTEEKMFLPSILSKTINQATVKGTESTHKLVSSINIFGENTIENKAPLITPMIAAVVLLLMTIVLTLLTITHKLNYRWFDAIFYSINGLLGCVILFLIVASKHPFTDVNYNIIWLNPLMGMPLLFLIFKKLRSVELIYHLLVAVTLFLFLLSSSIMEQEFNLAIYPFILAYIVRSMSYIRKQK